MDLQISVQSADWGDCSPTDIQVLLADVASHINRHLREPVSGLIAVIPAPNSNYVPMTYFRSTADQPFLVQLAAGDKRWAQFAYQFSHEFCHILSNPERLRHNQNKWFIEALCELSSIFTLRRMAENWVLNPPYANWSDYSASLSSYAEDRLSNQKHQLPLGIHLPDWFVLEEESLRSDWYQREKNAVVANCLLPFFEENPSGWNAIRAIPNSASDFAQYLAEWHSDVDNEDRAFLEDIFSEFDVDMGKK